MITVLRLLTKNNLPDACSCSTLLTTLLDGVNRLATSAYKPTRLGKSLLLGLSRRVGQSYPLVADQVDLQPYIRRCSAARHCEIRPIA